MVLVSFTYSPAPPPNWSVKAPAKKDEPNFSPADGSAPRYVPPSGGRSRSRPRSDPPMSVAPTPVSEKPPEASSEQSSRSFRQPVDFPVYGPPEAPQRPVSVLSPASQPEGLDRTAQNLRIVAQQRGDNLQGNVIGFGAGFVQAGSDTLRFGRQFVTNPVGTVRGTAQGVWTLASDSQARSALRDDFSYRVKTEPGYVAGGVAFDLIPIALPSGVSKARQAKAAARSPTPAPSKTPIGRGVTIGSDTVVDFDFVNPADRRVLGAQSARPDGGFVTELSVADRRFVVRDSQPTSLISFDDAGKMKSELLFDRRVQTFDSRGRLLSTTDNFATAPSPVTVRDTTVNREILSVVEYPVDRRSGAFATSTAQTRFTSEQGGLFVKGASATRQDTLTLANWRETVARLERGELTGEFRDVTPPQFTFKNVREPADKIILSREGDTRFTGQIAQSRSFTEGAVSTRGSFDVFNQPPPKNTGSFDFSSLQEPPRPSSLVPESVLNPKPTSAPVASSGPGGLASPTVIPRGFGQSQPPPTVSIRDLPEFRAATASSPQVRGFEGITTSSLPTTRFERAGVITLLPPNTDSPTQTSGSLPSLTPQSASSSLLGSGVGRSLNFDSVQQPRTSVTPFLMNPVDESVETGLRTSSGSRRRTGTIPAQSNPPAQTQKPIPFPPSTVTSPRIPTPRLRAPRAFVPAAAPMVGVLPLLAPRIRSSSAFAPGYRVFVRRGGEFKPTGPVLSRSEALEFGAFKVDATPAASFKIKPAGSAPTGSFGGRGFFGFFKPSKREPGVFVEPAKRRIRTPGELRGITFKGIQAKRLTPRRVFK